MRYKPDGSENPEFILNREPYRGAQILLTGVNFGCGSSREGAVWALQEMGIRCVIGSSFGDIFFNNCFQNGLLPVILDRETVESLAREVEASQGAGRISVDLEADDRHRALGQAPFVRRRARAPRGAARRPRRDRHDAARAAEIAAFQARTASSGPGCTTSSRSVL